MSNPNWCIASDADDDIRKATREYDQRLLQRAVEIATVRGSKARGSEGAALIERQDVAAALAEQADAEREAEVRRLREQRDELLRVLEPLLVQVEPLRYEQRQDIEKACELKAEWAKQHNARCGNSNEMWFYMTEYRRSLEGAIEPLSKVVREANEVYDRISAKDQSQ